MKKIFIILLCLCVSVLTACSNNEEPIKEPTESPENTDNLIWDRDAFEHWTNENGEKANIAEHSFDELGVCGICGSEVIDWGDGTYDVYNYDGNYNLLRNSTYDSDGNLLSDNVNEHVYDENGNVISSKSYTNGVFSEEYEYTVDADGNQIPVSSVFYYEDGGKNICEYNENGDISESLYYIGDELSVESYYEYSESSDGWMYNSKLTETYHDTGSVYIYEYNDQNDIISRIEKDPSGNVVLDEKHEYKYNDEGWKIYHKTTLSGELYEEIYFGIYDDGEGSRWTYYEKHIQYNSDGTYIVSEYDENDELIKETAYDAEGNVIA